MVLDATAIANLEILTCSHVRILCFHVCRRGDSPAIGQGEERGSLYDLLCRCVTPFGKRRMRQWLCHPLRSPSDIEQRLAAVEELLGSSTLRDGIPQLETFHATDRHLRFDDHPAFESHLRKLPDLERMLSLLHACSPRTPLHYFITVIRAFSDTFVWPPVCVQTF